MVYLNREVAVQPRDGAGGATAVTTVKSGVKGPASVSASTSAFVPVSGPAPVPASGRVSGSAEVSAPASNSSHPPPLKVRAQPPHGQRQTFSQISANANANANANTYANANTNANANAHSIPKSFVVPASGFYEDAGKVKKPQTQTQTQTQTQSQTQAKTNAVHQPQATMQFSNGVKPLGVPPYVPAPQTHMDLTDFQSRPLYSTRDFAFQPISEFFFFLLVGYS